MAAGSEKRFLDEGNLGLLVVTLHDFPIKIPEIKTEMLFYGFLKVKEIK